METKHTNKMKTTTTLIKGMSKSKIDRFEKFCGIALQAIITRGMTKNQESIVNHCDLATAYAIEMMSQIDLYILILDKLCHSPRKK